MTTDHRAEADRWIEYANEREDNDRAIVDALLAIAHALLAEPKPHGISTAQWEAESAYKDIVSREQWEGTR